MESVHLLPKWKRWIKPGRLIPFLTILGAGSAGVLSFLEVIALSIPEGVIIALLSLLAVDALIERLDILKGIDARLNKITTSEATLKRRLNLPPVGEQAMNASEICIITIAATTLATYHRNFFERKIRSGCKIRIVVLNPEGPSLQTWNLQSKMPRTEEFIRTTLATLQELALMNKVRGKCEIRLINVFLPFSMFAVDLQKGSGSMVVEYHVYKDTPEERPHLFFTPQNDPYWFNFYRQQFEQAWSEATVWTP